MSREGVYAVLLWGLWPLWLVAGVADWACHRRTRIERTSGRQEWLLHALQAGQLGIALALALFVEMTLMALLAMAFIVLVHWATAYVDTRYTYGVREIAPFEQSVHALLSLIPVFAVVLLALAHPQAWASPDWGIVPKASPIPAALLVAFIGPTLALQLVPLMEEGFRCRLRGRIAT
jgi:hypothetical protein